MYLGEILDGIGIYSFVDLEALMKIFNSIYLFNQIRK